MNGFVEVDKMRFWCQKVLPLVYEDSLSYYEVLGKVVKKLNDLIENNSILPTYIQELVESYITSGAIGEVVRNILTDYMLNVKNPPNGLKPAVGDGSEDDTIAIQGCIDYAKSNGGGCVYIPNGVYLTQSLALHDDVSLFGFDRYSAKLVLKGGAKKPLISGNVTNVSITGLTLDGNMDIQVNNINLIDVKADELNLQNLLLTDGYTLVNVDINKSMQISNVVCDYAVVRHMNVSGKGNLMGTNLYLHDISKLKGEDLVTLNISNSILSNVFSDGETPVAFIINGNNNNVSGTVNNAIIPFKDNGVNNTIINTGKTEQLKITGNRTNIVGGTEINNVVGKYQINSEDINLNSTNPIEYKKPVNLNEYFKTIPFKNGIEEYDVLVKGENDVEDGIKSVGEELKILIDSEKNERILEDARIVGLIDVVESERILEDARIVDLIDIEKSERILEDVVLSKKIDELEELNGFVNVKHYGVIGDGVSDNTDNLIQANLDDGFNTLLFTKGVYLVNGDVTFSKRTIFNEGATIKVVGGVITFEGEVIAGEYQIVDSDDDFVLNYTKNTSVMFKNHIVKVEWLGALKVINIDDLLDIPDQTNNIMKAIRGACGNFVHDGNRVVNNITTSIAKLGNGFYRVDGTINTGFRDYGTTNYYYYSGGGLIGNGPNVSNLIRCDLENENPLLSLRYYSGELTIAKDFKVSAYNPTKNGQMRYPSKASAMVWCQGDSLIMERIWSSGAQVYIEDSNGVKRNGVGIQFESCVDTFVSNVFVENCVTNFAFSSATVKLNNITSFDSRENSIGIGNFTEEWPVVQTTGNKVFINNLDARSVVNNFITVLSQGDNNLSVVGANVSGIRTSNGVKSGTSLVHLLKDSQLNGFINNVVSNNFGVGLLYCQEGSNAGGFNFLTFDNIIMTEVLNNNPVQRGVIYTKECVDANVIVSNLSITDCKPCLIMSKHRLTVDNVFLKKYQGVSDSGGSRKIFVIEDGLLNLNNVHRDVGDEIQLSEIGWIGAGSCNVNVRDLYKTERIISGVGDKTMNIVGDFL